MRILCIATIASIAVFNSPKSYACTAGGVPCDQVYREQLQSIDHTRTENIRRQEQIENQQHEYNLARIRREQELRAARSVQNPAPSAAINNQVPNAGRASTNSQIPAECQAFPSMCSAYK